MLKTRCESSNLERLAWAFLQRRRGPRPSWRWRTRRTPIIVYAEQTIDSPCGFFPWPDWPDLAKKRDELWPTWDSNMTFVMFLSCTV